MQSENSTILGDTITMIGRILGSELDEITVERAVVGLFFTGVKLSNGTAGTSATPIKSIPEAVCCPSSAMAMPFPGRLRGRAAADLAREALSGHGIRRTVGIATVNALADYCWQRRPHPDVELRHGVDAFDATEIRHCDRVVVVGAFVPFLKELKRRGQAFLVLEQDPATLKADELPFFRPAEQAAEILPNADVVLITGSTLVSNTLEHLLVLARPDARVTVVGPTVGCCPMPFSPVVPMFWAASGLPSPIHSLTYWPRVGRATISSAARHRSWCSCPEPRGSIPEPRSVEQQLRSRPDAEPVEKRAPPKVADPLPENINGRITSSIGACVSPDR